MYITHLFLLSIIIQYYKITHHLAITLASLQKPDAIRTKCIESDKKKKKKASMENNSVPILFVANVSIWSTATVTDERTDTIMVTQWTYPIGMHPSVHPSSSVEPTVWLHPWKSFWHGRLASTANIHRKVLRKWVEKIRSRQLRHFHQLPTESSR